MSRHCTNMSSSNMAQSHLNPTRRRRPPRIRTAQTIHPSFAPTLTLSPRWTVRLHPCALDAETRSNPWTLSHLLLIAVTTTPLLCPHYWYPRLHGQKLKTKLFSPIIPHQLSKTSTTNYLAFPLGGVGGVNVHVPCLPRPATQPPLTPHPHMLPLPIHMATRLLLRSIGNGLHRPPPPTSPGCHRANSPLLIPSASPPFRALLALMLPLVDASPPRSPDHSPSGSEALRSYISSCSSSLLYCKLALTISYLAPVFITYWMFRST